MIDNCNYSMGVHDAAAYMRISVVTLRRVLRLDNPYKPRIMTVKGGCYPRYRRADLDALAAYLATERDFALAHYYTGREARRICGVETEAAFVAAWNGIKDEVKMAAAVALFTYGEEYDHARYDMETVTFSYTPKNTCYRKTAVEYVGETYFPKYDARQVAFAALGERSSQRTLHPKI